MAESMTTTEGREMSGTVPKPRGLNGIMEDAGVTIVRDKFRNNGPREYWLNGEMILRTSSYDTAWNFAKERGWTLPEDEE